MIPSRPVKRHNLIYSIFDERCPRCRQTKVFLAPRNIFALPEMKKQCEACGYKFDREPGYFLGAMYISYGISVFLGLLAFLACYFFFPDLPTIWVPVIILLVITLFAIKSWKLSRIIYMHIFPW